jgi:hypothetical protein
MLKRQGKSFKDIVDVLRVYQENVTENAPPEGQPSQVEILQYLMGFLEQA